MSTFDSSAQISSDSKDFDRLMSQSYTAKQLEMDKQQKVFHQLPSFLKVGVYYKTKHEIIR